MAPQIHHPYAEVSRPEGRESKSKNHPPLPCWYIERFYALWSAAIHVDCSSCSRQSVCRCALHVSVQLGYCAVHAGSWLHCFCPWQKIHRSGYEDRCCAGRCPWLAMLSQGGSLSGWISPDLLLVLIIAFCIVGVLFSIPVENSAVKSLVKAAFPVIVVGAYVLWSFQGTLVQNSSDTENNVEVVDGVQVVNSTLHAGRYPNITVHAGIPVKWVIDAPDGSINGCNNRILISDYGIEYTFHTGENVIEFTPVTAGTVRYSCWMGMIRGNIFVMDGTENDIAASSTEVSVPPPAGYTIPTETLAIALPTTDESENELQEVSIKLTDNGFSPAVIVVQRDLPVYWNIENNLTDAENGTNLLFPYYSTQLALGAGDNLLSLYPSESFDVSTGDNRFYCYVKVVYDLSVVDESTVRKEVDAYEPLIYPSEVFESSGMACCGQ